MPDTKAHDDADEAKAATAEEDARASKLRRDAALRALGFPEREVKSVREDDDAVIVEHQGGAVYRVAADGSTETVENAEGKRWPRNRVVADGADVPPVVTAAANTQANGSSELADDVDLEERQRLAELTEPDEAKDDEAKDDGDQERTPAKTPRRAQPGDVEPGKIKDGGTTGTTDAARARGR